MTPFVYVAISIAFLILVLGLFRKTRPKEFEEWQSTNYPTPSAGNGGWVHLSERIFDPSDARWLEEELGFPKLAKILMIERQRLAIHWLEALRASFDELVRTPEFSPGEALEAGSVGSWQMLWLTFRFKTSISYALLVVKSFGPYHRLIPTFSWVPISRGSGHSFRRPALANGRNSR
jgi:hypothetical protein